MLKKIRKILAVLMMFVAQLVLVFGALPKEQAKSMDCCYTQWHTMDYYNGDYCCYWGITCNPCAVISG